MENKDFGFSESFVSEMNNDTKIAKKSNRMSAIGEIASYFVYGSEAVKNIIFFIYMFSLRTKCLSGQKCKSEFESGPAIFLIFSALSLIFIIILLKNFINVSKLLNNGILPTSDKLYLLGISIYTIHGHLFLNAYFLYHWIQK